MSRQGPSVTVTVDRYHGLDVQLHKAYLKNIRRATQESSNQVSGWAGTGLSTSLRDAVA